MMVGPYEREGSLQSGSRASVATCRNRVGGSWKVRHSIRRTNANCGLYCTHAMEARHSATLTHEVFLQFSEPWVRLGTRLHRGQQLRVMDSQMARSLGSGPRWQTVRRRPGTFRIKKFVRRSRCFDAISPNDHTDAVEKSELVWKPRVLPRRRSPGKRGRGRDCWRRKGSAVPRGLLSESCLVSVSRGELG